MFPQLIIPIPESVQDQMDTENEDEFMQQAMEDGYVPWEDGEES